MRSAAASTRATCRRCAAILHAAAKDDYRFSSIVLGIVRSVPFRMRMTPDVERDTDADRARQ